MPITCRSKRFNKAALLEWRTQDPDPKGQESPAELFFVKGVVKPTKKKKKKEGG